MTAIAKTAPTLGELRARKDEILRLAEQYGATNVRVFGSVAREEARSDSDIDLLVSFPSNRSIFDLVALWLDLKELFDREVDLVTDQGMRDSMRATVLKDAVPL